MRHAAVRVLGCGAAAAGLLLALPAQASESGASIYLLGSGGPEAAALPPIQGVFLANTAYYYEGDSGGDKQFPIGGSLVAGLHGQILADFATVLWVPTTDLGGATLAVGAALPVGQVKVDVAAVITGPRGNSAAFDFKDDVVAVGDPILTAALGWKQGRLSWQASALVNVPVGDYRDRQLANLAFHRWATDVSFAMTWHDEATGWDLSGKAGVTYNGTNEATDYTTGVESHYEASLAKAFNPAWSAGLQAYYFEQVTGDTGPGALLGPFKGRVAGVGGQVAYNFKIAGKIPATLRLHALTEFEARNRLEGTSVFLDFTMPLWVKLPPGAHP